MTQEQCTSPVGGAHGHPEHTEAIESLRQQLTAQHGAVVRSLAEFRDTHRATTETAAEHAQQTTATLETVARTRAVHHSQTAESLGNLTTAHAEARAEAAEAAQQTAAALETAARADAVRHAQTAEALGNLNIAHAEARTEAAEAAQQTAAALETAARGATVRHNQTTQALTDLTAAHTEARAEAAEAVKQTAAALEAAAQGDAARHAFITKTLHEIAAGQTAAQDQAEQAQAAHTAALASADRAAAERHGAAMRSMAELQATYEQALDRFAETALGELDKSLKALAADFAARMSDGARSLKAIEEQGKTVLSQLGGHTDLVQRLAATVQRAAAVVENLANTFEHHRKHQENVPDGLGATHDLLMKAAADAHSAAEAGAALRGLAFQHGNKLDAHGKTVEAAAAAVNTQGEALAANNRLGLEIRATLTNVRDQLRTVITAPKPAGKQGKQAAQHDAGCDDHG